MSRVLLLSPYSPLESHDHAAADYVAPLISELAKLVDLHVYAPTAARLPLSSADGATYHRASPVSRPLTAMVGVYPYHFREAWAHRSTRELLRIVEEIKPDVVHMEYMQPAEAIVALRAVPVTMTLHDLMTRAYRQTIRAPWYTPRGTFNRVELMRYSYWEKRAIKRSAHVFTLSEDDAKYVSQFASSSSSPKIGVALEVQRWSRVERAAPVLLFPGAMWRTANALSAEYLANQVLPIVRRSYPDAVLRIVGARPRESVHALSRIPGVNVVGAVNDYLGEFALADVVLTPSSVEAGVLLKTLHSFAAGAPTVLNSYAARGLDGLQHGRDAVVSDDARSMAAAISRILSEPAYARRLGAAGRQFVERNHSWKAFAQAYTSVFCELAATGSEE